MKAIIILFTVITNYFAENIVSVMKNTIVCQEYNCEGSNVILHVILHKASILLIVMNQLLPKVVIGQQYRVALGNERREYNIILIM